MSVPVETGTGTVTARMLSFTGLVDGREHIALVFGERQRDVPLVRVHSECLTGDVFGSGRCDCGPQLREALDLLARHGGILLYLRQEAGASACTTSWTRTSSRTAAWTPSRPTGS